MGDYRSIFLVLSVSIIVFLSGCIEERSQERELDDVLYSEVVGSSNATLNHEYLNRSDLSALSAQDDICYEMICLGMGVHNLTLEDFTTDKMNSMNYVMINATVQMKITIGPRQISNPSIRWFIQDIQKDINYSYDNNTGSIMVNALLFQDQAYDKETFYTFSISIRKMGGFLPITLFIDHIYLKVDYEVN